jgi:hypothetical protein
MNLDDTVSGINEGRLRFIKHKGQTVLTIDFRECESKEMLLLLDQVKSTVERHAPRSLLILSDFAGAHFDKQVATRAKEVLVLDRPYVKKSAWIGAESVPHVYYENFKSFSQRELPTFKSREEALNWLVEE